MAQVICMAVTNGTDPGHWKQGDIVDVLDDGVFPGNKVMNRGAFVIVDVPGTAAEVKAQLKKRDIVNGVEVSRSAVQMDVRGGFVDKRTGTRKFQRTGDAVVRLR